MPPTAVLLLLMAAPAHAEDVGVTCSTPSGVDACDRWYSSPWVTVQWSWDPGGMIVSGCTNANQLSEGRVERACRVQWGGTTESRDIWIGIDRTAPAVTGFATARPADHAGWFNHPVTVAFTGSDSLSGVAACSSVTYAGPDGPGAPVAGSCTDVAGNTGSAALPLNYDATAPRAPVVEATPGDRMVALRWSGVEGAEVTRLDAGEATVVYRGTAGAFTDRGLRNEQRYRYVVTLTDQAGNRAAGETTAVPTASPLLTPAARQRLTAPPLLRWRKVRRATYYNVQLFSRGRKLLSRWPRTNELQLTRRWRFAGRTRRLGPGRYCWYVWPGFGRRAERDYGRLLGKRCFVVTR